MKRLTLELKPKVYHPYASRDRYDQFFPVPDGNASSAHDERMTMPRVRWLYHPTAEEDIHAEYDQE
jgi:hypothetical protein